MNVLIYLPVLAHRRAAAKLPLCYGGGGGGGGGGGTGLS